MVEPKSNDVCQVRCFNVELVAQVNEALLGDGLLEAAQILFGALADRSRLKILYALSRDEELCVCDIATLLEIKIAAASHHLRKLRDLKIVLFINLVMFAIEFGAGIRADSLSLTLRCGSRGIRNVEGRSLRWSIASKSC